MSEEKTDKIKPFIRFLFGDGRPGFATFCQVALFRLALTYPFCVLLSNSLTDAWDLLLIAFWLLSFNWKEKFRILKNSPILVVSLILVLVSFIGVFQFEDSFFKSLKYWRGHHPIPILIVLATILPTKAKRIQMLNSLSLAMVVVMLYSFFVIHIAPLLGWERLRPGHIAANTIWFGMAYVFWAGLLICVPFSIGLPSRLRPILPGSIRRAMRNVSRFSIWDYFRSISRQTWQVHFFRFLQLGFLFFCLINIFWINPSRTGWVAVIAGITTLLLLWDWRKGIPISLFLVIGFVIPAGCFSSSFQRRLESTSGEIVQYAGDLMLHGDEVDKVPVHKRFPLYRRFVKDIIDTPLGMGMMKTRDKCLFYSREDLDNCHNEFIAFAMHSGWHGLACFLVWFFFLYRQSLRLDPPWKLLGVYATVTLFTACIFNGVLSQDMEGHLFCILIALLASEDAEKNLRLKNRASEHFITRDDS